MEIIGFTCSAFDLCHAGHVLMLEQCKQHCDKLVIGIQNDPSSDRHWKNTPIQTLKERIIQIKAIRYVDEIIMYEDEKELLELLKYVKPDVRFLGSDYIGKRFTGDQLDIKCIYLDRSHGYSSTELRKRIWEAENAIRNPKRDC